MAITFEFSTQQLNSSFYRQVCGQACLILFNHSTKSTDTPGVMSTVGASAKLGCMCFLITLLCVVQFGPTGTQMLPRNSPEET